MKWSLLGITNLEGWTIYNFLLQIPIYESYVQMLEHPIYFEM